MPELTGVYHFPQHTSAAVPEILLGNTSAPDPVVPEVLLGEEDEEDKENVKPPTPPPVPEIKITNPLK